MSNEHKIKITASAQWQIALMIQNEFNQEKYGLRMSIDGKGCDGFSYAIGFTEIKKNGEHPDLIFTQEISDINGKPYQLKVIMDPFAAHYLQIVTVDYQFNPETEEEGFIVSNHSQKKFHGKFWRKNPDLAPKNL